MQHLDMECVWHGGDGIPPHEGWVNTVLGVEIELHKTKYALIRFVLKNGA
jgi:hypothetical protein